MLKGRLMTDSNQVRPTARRKPPAAGKGRPKGATGKIPREVKAMILEALEGAGGVQYLEARAHDPKTASAFLTLVGKVLPLQLSGDPTNPITIAWPVAPSRVEQR